MIITRWTLIIALTIFSLTACNKQEKPQGLTSTSFTTPTYLKGLNSVDQYFMSLPHWNEFSPPEDAGDTLGEKKTEKHGANICTYQQHTLKSSPDKLVLYPGSDSVLWPGAILQGKDYKAGVLTPVTISLRSPVKVTSDLLIKDPFRTVDQPDYGGVQAAIGDIITEAKNANVIPGSKFDYKVEDAYSYEQLALKLGISAKYFTQDVKAKLDVTNTTELHTVAAYFVQTFFTMSVARPDQKPSSFFSDNFSRTDIDDLEKLGSIGVNNIPLYVADVTYGRTLLFTLTSRERTEDISAAIEYSYTGAGSVEGKAEAAYKKILKNSVIKIVAIGGDEKDIKRLIVSGQMKDYFSDNNTALTSARPLSYTLRTLSDNVQASIASTADYQEISCQPDVNDFVKSNAKIKLKFKDNRYMGKHGWVFVSNTLRKEPYPTLGPSPRLFKLGGNSEALKHGSTITLLSTDKKLIKDKRYVLGRFAVPGLYFSSPGNAKENWRVEKVNTKSGNQVRYGDAIRFKNAKKNQYMCDYDNYLTTRTSAKRCIWYLVK